MPDTFRDQAQAGLLTGFTLEVSDSEAPARPVQHALDLGTAPLGELPKGGPTYPKVYEPCSCGALVLTVQTTSGALLALNIQEPTYAVTWKTGAAWPTAYQGRGYVQHQCPEGASPCRKALES